MTAPLRTHATYKTGSGGWATRKRGAARERKPPRLFDLSAKAIVTQIADMSKSADKRSARIHESILAYFCWFWQVFGQFWSVFGWFLTALTGLGPWSVADQDRRWPANGWAKYTFMGAYFSEISAD